MVKFLNLNYTFNFNLKKLFTYLLIAFIGLIVSCQPRAIKYVSINSSIAMDSTQTNHELTEELIAPYKIKLDAEMNEVLVISAEEFPKEKGKPETKLGNLVADLSFEIAQEMYGDSIDFCLLNFGGLRTSLPKGEITRGKIYELMPFENELVVLEVSFQSFHNLVGYINKVGGQPIGGDLKLSFKGDLSNITHSKKLGHLNRTSVKVLTTDYLANGGDNMSFFANPIKYEKVGIKLRDAIIQYCIEQHKQEKQLTSILDGRIVFEK